MRLMLSTILAACVMTVAATTARADVTEGYVADPNIEGGGYYELTVHNNSGAEMYMVCVGNNGADVIFTDPSLVGQWRGRRDNVADWDLGIAVYDAGFTFPNTGSYPSATYFAGYAQVLTYYVLAANPPSIPGGSPIARGGTQSGFRFKSTAAGSPYVIFGLDGTVVEQGQTEDPLADEETTWGSIKALYR